MKKAILDCFRGIVEKKFSAMKTRFHGDYHLGQVLFTGNDFVIIDFEGEPARPLTERRLKRSPLRDIAGMIRSFHYATYHILLKQSSVRSEDVALLEPWTAVWHCTVGGIFLNAYLRAAGDASFLPQDRSQLEAMLRIFLLEKAVYELGYEINNRPDWVMIPLRGMRQIMDGIKG